MLNKLRNFTKTKLATVLIGIIIIPFVFWGMGGVFQGGNTNNIAKIKNVNISTEDFFEHINSNLWLCVRNENTRAISFYEKVGFEKDGDIAWKSGELPGTVFCKRKVDLFG